MAYSTAMTDENNPLERKQLETNLEDDITDPDSLPALSSFPSIEDAAKVVQNIAEDQKKFRKHQPTVHARQLVANMAACGIPAKTIAKIFNITEKTLYKHYGTEIETSQALAVSHMSSNIYQRALDKNDKTSAILAMFWMKAVGNFRDSGPVQNQQQATEEGYEVTTIKKRLTETIEVKKTKTTKSVTDESDDDDHDDHLTIDQEKD